MNIECPKGHTYKYIEETPDFWPEGAPLCPICCKTWIYTHPHWDYNRKLQVMAKVKSRLEESHIGQKRKLELRILPEV